MIASPGNSTTQKAWCAYCWLPATIVPQVGISGGTPTPRNDRPASARIAYAKMNDTCTRIGDIRFGNMCRHRMREVRTPSARTASTKSSSRTTSVEARTTRATRGVYTSTSASTVFSSEGPRIATSAMASRMSGKDIIASTTRISGVSSRRKKPAISPSTVPATTAPSAVSAAMASE
jgi:hypothetical protein